MSVFTLDQILQTDRFVIEEIFELTMSEPELAYELKSIVQDSFDDDQVYEVTRNNRTYM